MKINTFSKRKITIISIFLLFCITLFLVCNLSIHKTSSDIYGRYIKLESFYFDLIHRNFPISVSDTSYNMMELEAYGKDEKLDNQNPDSLYLKIKKVFPEIERITIFDFYNKNKNKTLIDVKELSCSIKTRKYFTCFPNSRDTIEVHFSQVGFNKDKSQAMLYVYTSNKDFSDYCIYFYKYKWGFWFKEAEINVQSYHFDYFPKEAPPPPPHF